MTVRDVVEAVQGPVSVSECGAGAAPCGRSASCAYNKVWRGADRLLSDYLGSITLKDLFELGGDHPSVREALGDSDDDCSACVGTFGLALEGGCHGKAPC